LLRRALRMSFTNIASHHYHLDGTLRAQLLRDRNRDR
jgi:adenosine deaminase